MAVFIETDIINKIRTKNAHKKYKEYEIVSPGIVNRFFINDNWKQWKHGLRYTSFVYPTPWGYGLVYILCQNPEISYIRSYDTNELQSWRNLWKHEPILVCCPIIDGCPSDYKSRWFLNINSKKYKLRSCDISNDIDIIDNLLAKNAFVVANGETFLIGLHRYGNINKNNLIKIWTEDKNISKEVYIDKCIYLEQLLIKYPVNTYIANHPEIYIGYGNASIDAILYVLNLINEDYHFEPIIERFSNSDDGIARIVYLSLYTVYLQNMNHVDLWIRIQPYINKMSLFGLYEWELENDRMTYHKVLPNHRAIIKGFLKIQQYREDISLLFEYFLWIKNEYNYNLHNMAKMLLIYSSISYKNIYYKGIKKHIHTLWNNILLLCFQNNKESFITWCSKLMIDCYQNTYECPPFEFLKTISMDQSNIFEKNIVSTLNKNNKIYSFYDILSLFIHHQCNTPYIFKKRYLQPMIQSKLLLIYRKCTEYPPGCIDALHDYFTRNKNALLT